MTTVLAEPLRSTPMISVVGGGISGLTVAVTLRRLGFAADVITAERHHRTVSAVAGAIWTRGDAEPLADVRRWALHTREVLGGLLTDPSTGVHPLTMVEYERADPGPTWWESTPYVERVPPAELPAAYAVGFRIDGTITVPAVHLAWLEDELGRLGGTVRERRVDRLTEVPGDLVVNCTGLGAASLVGDRSMFGIRGQLVLVRDPGIVVGRSDENDPVDVAYVYPRPDGVVVGGSRIHADPSEREGDPDPALTRRILADAMDLEPLLADPVVEGVRVGLRPGRPSVRVEAERLTDGRWVVHDYGHGGCGYLLSWGCADEVARFVLALDGR
ncbi:MAG: FAD-dependent oxidoreductase [Ilumatobacteraceae bacterium]